jgi:zona occludens toxin
VINGLVGSPGSGKSYEAVVFHILPALQEGRKVITNLPLNIAEFEARVPGSAALIQILEPELGKPRRFVQVQDYLDDWRAEGTNQGPLIVVDEAHHVFRGKVAPELLEYFALHRHYGVDILLVTQAWRQVHPEIRDMVQVCYRVRKATALGSSKQYIRKVQDGVRGEVTNQNIRTYDPKNYPLYRSHTQTNRAVMEAAAKDVKPIWKHWSVYGAAICAVFAVYGIFNGGVDPFASSKKIQAAVKPSPPAKSSAPVPLPSPSPAPPPAPVAPELPPPVKPAKVDDPFSGHGLHIGGYLSVNGRARYQVLVSQNGQVVARIDDRDLVQAGYQVVQRGRCTLELIFESTRRWAVCDSPHVSIAAVVDSNR